MICHRHRTKSFTLVELLAVVMVLLMLAGIMISVAGYAQKKMQTQVTRTQIAIIAAALESYKADWGYYPVTTPIRCSAEWMGEATNNALLYNALFMKGKKYLSGFPTNQIRPNYATDTATTGPLTNIFDVFGKPFNYYNSPATAFRTGVLTNDMTGATNAYSGFSVGGQVNVITYDLFSYGPDHLTFVAANLPGPLGGANVSLPWTVPGWRTPSAANDDITNWRR